MQHQAFIDEIESYDLDEIDQMDDKEEVLKKMLSFVTDWLVDHILNVDTQIGK